VCGDDVAIVKEERPMVGVHAAKHWRCFTRGHQNTSNTRLRMIHMGVAATGRILVSPLFKLLFFSERDACTPKG
jgi:hypothetical protein